MQGAKSLIPEVDAVLSLEVCCREFGRHRYGLSPLRYNDRLKVVDLSQTPS